MLLKTIKSIQKNKWRTSETKELKQKNNCNVKTNSFKTQVSKKSKLHINPSNTSTEQNNVDRDQEMQEYLKASKDCLFKVDVLTLHKRVCLFEK